MDSSDIIENQSNNDNLEQEQQYSHSSKKENEQEDLSLDIQNSEKEVKDEDIQQQKQLEENQQKQQLEDYSTQSQDNKFASKKKSLQNKAIDQKYKTPQQHQDTDAELFSTATKESRKSGARSKKKSQKKNFLEDNLNVKTLQTLSKEKFHQRRSSACNPHKQMSNYLQMRQSLAPHDNKGRLESWKKIVFDNDYITKPCPAQTSLKNQSKEFVVKHIEIFLNDLQDQNAKNNLGGTFSKNKKEKAYHLTNSSSIALLPSYQSLDCLDKQQIKVIERSKGNQTLKRSANQSHVFDRQFDFVKPESLPEGYASHRGKKPLVHNMTNNAVQAMRLKNKQSSHFDQ